MPKLIPYSLTFRGGMHVGQGAESLTVSRLSIPSDTLFAALLDTWRYLGGDVDAFVHPFRCVLPDPPFLLTSAFPYAGEVRFYPLPVSLGALFGADILSNFDWNKPLKRLRYFSEALLRKALAGERLDGWLFPKDEHTEPTTGIAMQGDALWLTIDEIAQLPAAFHRDPGKRHALRRLKVWNNGSVPRVTVDRVNSASTIYHASRVTFLEDCGLWFGVDWRVVGQNVILPYSDAFEKIMKTLGESGLGGERTTGYGGFNYRAGEAIVLDDPRSEGIAFLLSRYHPRTEELATVHTNRSAAYRLESVAGWLRTPTGASQRRKRLWLVSEGSLVGGVPGGDVTDVRPTYQNPDGDVPHPVYRSGLAVAIGWPDSTGEEARNG